MPARVKWLLPAAAVLLAGCTGPQLHPAAEKVYNKPEDHPPPLTTGMVDVPPLQLPPDGRCRIWYPDRTAEQQPPPGPCDEMYWRLRHGSALIRG